LPVSADLEKGFGAQAETVAEMIRLAAGVGLVGCTIEDLATTTIPVYDVGGSHTGGTRTAGCLYFMLTAQAHNFLYPAPSLEGTISRP
jgi:Phosphoenolpyruvate phosphomutase